MQGGAHRKNGHTVDGALTFYDMRKITDIQELRGVQLDILDDIHAFCTANGIKYFLSCGTLIGAVRHKGYIPWDDDLDIYMPREDYERFLREYESPSGHCRVLDPAKEKHYYYTFAKVVDTRTLLTETEAEGYRIGIYVDVFPVDYVTDDATARRRLFKRKRLLYKIRRCKISKHNYLKSPVAFWCYKLLPVSAGMIERLLRRMLIRREPTSTVANVTEAGPSVKGCMPAKDIEDSVDIMFEGKMYKTMIGYEDYLRRTYGDYMTLPPVEQRVTHSFEAYWLE